MGAYICHFCGRDPMHYVNNGIGMEAVAFEGCCEEGEAAYDGDERLRRIARLISSLDRRQVKRGRRLLAEQKAKRAAEWEAA
jgi:hypothetical protein